jgi:hypothetical protein
MVPFFAGLLSSKLMPGDPLQPILIIDFNGVDVHSQSAILAKAISFKRLVKRWGVIVIDIQSLSFQSLIDKYIHDVAHHGAL